MFKLIQVLSLTIVLCACSKTIIPETPIQMQTVSYAQIASIAVDVYNACQSKLLSKDNCISMYENIETAKVIVDSGVGLEEASELLNNIRSQL